MFSVFLHVIMSSIKGKLLEFKMNICKIFIVINILFFSAFSKADDEIVSVSPVLEAVDVSFPDFPEIKRNASGFVPIRISTVHAGIFDADPQVVLRKTAFVIHKFSKEEGFEACARMCVGDIDGYRVFGMRVLTTHSQIACMQPANPENACPSGFNISNSGVRIHSHPHKERIRLNLVDSTLRSGLRRGMSVNVQPFWFSPRDIMNGPGYLVTPNRFLKFDGKNYFSWNKNVSVWESIPPENE